MTRDEVEHHWLEQLLPLWRDCGFDREHGGFVNRLTSERTPTADPFKRLLVQCRQIWTFSSAAQRGAGDWALDLANAGRDFLKTRLFDADHGGYFLTCTLEGEPLDRRKDLYGHGFVILAFAELYRASGDAGALADANDALEIVQARLRDPVHGGFFEAAEANWSVLQATRRQNPHMHLFEAVLALHDARPDAAVLEQATALLGLLERAFFDEATGSLCEYFDETWKPQPGVEGRLVEPGHHFEWVYLLHSYARRVKQATSTAADRLFEFASENGVDSDGGVFDRIDCTGKLLLDTKRLWPQTEYVRALVARAEHSKSDSARDAAQDALETVMHRYVDPRCGGWYEQLDCTGAPISDSMNATSVYHVTGALIAVLDLMDAG
ncbi:MAG: hypothetical protein GY725_19465 [bacterium]|nr:hypothetical protein [bacterium]